MKRALSPPGLAASLMVACGASSCFLFPPGTPVDFCIAQAEVFCDLQFRCCTAAERGADPAGLFTGPSSQRHPASDVGECKELSFEVCRAAADQLNESLAAERIRYDADEAHDCLDDLRSAVDSCDPTDFFEASGTWLTQLIDTGQPGVLGKSCDDVLEPNVDTDDECFADYECEKGSCVVQNTANEVSAEGECQGESVPSNPLDGTIDFDICDGLEDNQP